MAMRFSTTLRTTRSTDIVTAAGAAAKIKFYNGAVPATGVAPGGALLATLTFGAVLGTVASGVLTLGAVTQSNSGHAAGTPTFARITTASDAFVADIDIGAGVGNMTFSGAIATGTDVNLNASTIIEGNA